MVLNVQSHYWKVTKGIIRNPEFFSAFFEPVLAVLLLRETVVIALFWVMIQLVAFLTPLLATVLLKSFLGNMALLIRSYHDILQLLALSWQDLS